MSPEFQAHLSHEDQDIASGDIPPETVQAYEQPTVAREAEGLRGFFEERSAIMQHDADLPRAEAELEAARITATLARNRGYLWKSLRSALAEYPALAVQLPDAPGPVDSLPLGIASVHVRSDGRALKQGVFSGAHAVGEDT